MPTRLLAASLAVAALVAAGCSGSPKSSAATGTTSSSSATTSTSASGTTDTTMPGATTTATTGRATTSTPTTAGVAGCTTAMLSAVLSNGNGAAGTIFYHLVFSNTSTKTCTIAGYPGLSFVDGAGHQIGAAVPRDTTSTFGGVVTLGQGASAGALFALHDAYVGSVTGCNPAAATGLRIYPPNQTTALFVAAPLQVCSNAATPGSASITPVTNLANLPG